LARPLALYDTALDSSGEPSYVDVVYLVLGKMTARLAHFLPGRLLDVWGPLGNGFPLAATDHLILVAGGIGQTPFLALAQECFGERHYGDPPRVAPRIGRLTLCYGARRAEFLAGVADFQRRGVDVRISTDDGSAGHHGLVTDLLSELLAVESGAVRSGSDRAPNAAATADNSPARRIICCGPERMMEAVAKIAAATGVPCQASLETPMACGIGICFSCVAKVRDSDNSSEWDYRRTCVEGPIFDAARIVW
jgi:dihydroorotate dehydrogenase electron transfer subunit